MSFINRIYHINCLSHSKRSLSLSLLVFYIFVYIPAYKVKIFVTKKHAAHIINAYKIIFSRHARCTLKKEVIN